MKKTVNREWKHYAFELLLTISSVFAASGIGYLFQYLGFPETNIVIIYLLSVLLTARFTNDFIFGIIGSVMSTFAFNYFFTAPYFTFAVNDPSYLVTFMVMTITSLATSTLTVRVKKSAREAEEREKEAKALYQLTNSLTEANSLNDILVISAKQISETLECDTAILCFDKDGKPEKSFVQCHGSRIVWRDYDEDDNISERLSDTRNSCIMGNEFCEWPIYGREGILGVLRMPKEFGSELPDRLKRLLLAMTESTAMSIDRFRVSEERIIYREESEQERYRGNLLRAISHDLRTPLSGIMGTSEMIMDMSRKGDPRYDLAEGIWNDADWLHSLVENILNLTRLDEGRLVLKKQPEAVEEIIGSALEHISKRAPEYTINVNIPEELLMVPMDAKLIVQVLVNLLDNAIKHTEPDRPITISVEKADDSAVFRVDDEGEGIAETDLPNVFEMFYTSKPNSPDAKSGVGLGLPICDAIIKAHGGNISVSNRKGFGAEVMFTLPLEHSIQYLHTKSGSRSLYTEFILDQELSDTNHA